MSPRSPGAPLVIGRYSLHDEIASGGMAAVHYGRLAGAEGFSRTVAIKRLHAHYAKDPEFVAMFLDEARLAARIRHPNVVPTLDVVALDGELFLVMDYVQGESLARLMRTAREEGTEIPIAIATSVVAGALHGLHAAHEATNEKGEPLDIIHRDVSPQNILVGTDGVPRLLDFGVARAIGRLHTTRDGQVKGKLAYMSPEQLLQGNVDRRTDIYAAGVVLWELLTGERLFGADNDGAVIAKVLEHRVVPPSTVVATIPRAIDELTMKALEREPTARFGTAREMAAALERIVSLATVTEIAEWVDSLASGALSARASVVADIESGARERTAPAEDIPSLPRVVEAESVTATATAVDTPPAKRRLGWWVASIAFAVATVATIATIRPKTPALATTSPPRVESAIAVPPAATSTPSLGSSATTTATSLGSPATTTSMVGLATAAPATSTRRSKTVPVTSPPSSSKPCAVKSFVDEAGVKHFYKDCLR